MARRPIKGAPLPPATVAGEAPAPSPKAHQVMRAYSFIGGMFDRGRFEWKPGEVVSDPDEISFLRERGVLLEPIPD